MRLSPGTRVGPYEVLAAIGAGGMGEVYRARDTKLEREVFYLDGGQIMVVAYSTAGDSFIAEKPKVWSQQLISATELFSSLDLSPDGKRFAVIPSPDKTEEREAVTRLSVLQNFFDEVRRRVS